MASTPAAANGPACSSPARIDSTPGRASSSRMSSAPRFGPTALGASAIAAGTPSTTSSAAGASGASGSLTRGLGRRCLVLHADSVDQRQDLPLQQLPARGAHVDAVRRAHVDPVECRGVDAVRAEHPVEVDHADLTGIGLRHLPHERVVRLGARGRVLGPRQAVGLAVAGIDVGHGEQHHFCTKRVEDGDGGLQFVRQVLVPGRLPDVHPLPVEQVVGHLPAAQAQRHHLGTRLADHEGPQRPPVVTARRGRPGRALGEHLEPRIEVAPDRRVVEHAHPVLGARLDREAHAERHGDGVPHDQEPTGRGPYAPARADTRRVLRRRAQGAGAAPPARRSIRPPALALAPAAWAAGTAMAAPRQTAAARPTSMLVAPNRRPRPPIASRPALFPLRPSLRRRLRRLPASISTTQDRPAKLDP